MRTASLHLSSRLFRSSAKPTLLPRAKPTLSATVVLQRLMNVDQTRFTNKSLRTVQIAVKAWRQESATFFGETISFSFRPTGWKCPRKVRAPGVCPSSTEAPPRALFPSALVLRTAIGSRVSE